MLDFARVFGRRRRGLRSLCTTRGEMSSGKGAPLSVNRSLFRELPRPVGETVTAQFPHTPRLVVCWVDGPEPRPPAILVQMPVL